MRTHRFIASKKEYKTKKESPIQEKCSCGSGSFLLKKKYRKPNWFCRRCGKEALIRSVSDVT